MATEKICPVRQAAKAVAAAAAASARATVTGSVACTGPTCAWYDAAVERCAVLSLARAAAGKGRP